MNLYLWLLLAAIAVVCAVMVGGPVAGLLVLAVVTVVGVIYRRWGWLK